MRTPPSLPEAYSEELASLPRKSPEVLSHIYALRQRGWPLRAIAAPLEISRVTVANWADEASKSKDIVLHALSIPAPHVPLDAKGQGIIVRKIPKGIPEKDRKRIQELTETASKNTRWSRSDSPERIASRELDELVDKYVCQRSVSASTFAEVAGVTRRAIMQRVERVEKK